MFLVEHVPGLSQGDNHNTKIAPLQTYGLKLINCPEGISLLKDQRPSWTHISSWNDGRFTDLSDQHSLSQNRGEWGAESWECKAETCERKARTQRYESHCSCKGCASRLYSTEDRERKFLSPLLRYSFLGELYHMPSP